MEFIVMILCVISGALVGTAAGIFLMFRRIRPAFTEAELSALRSGLRAAEASAAMVAERDDLRRQVAERERVMERHAAELDDKQQQLALALAEAEKEAAKRAAAEQKIWELSSEAASLAEERAAVEAGFEEEKKRIAALALAEAEEEAAKCAAAEQRIRELSSEAASLAEERAAAEAGFEEEKKRIAALALAEAEEEAAKCAVAEQRIRELSSEAASLAGERAAVEAGFVALNAQGEADRRRIEELESEIGCVAAQYNELKAQLGGELERVRYLTDQVAALETERQSAARGIELLLMAQQNLSGFLKPLNGDPAPPSNGGAPGEIAAAMSNGL